MSSLCIQRGCDDSKRVLKPRELHNIHFQACKRRACTYLNTAFTLYSDRLYLCNLGYAMNLSCLIARARLRPHNPTKFIIEEPLDAIANSFEMSESRSLHTLSLRWRHTFQGWRDDSCTKGKESYR